MAKTFSAWRRRLVASLPLAAGALSRAAAGEVTAEASGEPTGEATLRNYPLITSDRVRLNVLEAAPATSNAPDAARPVIVLVPGWCMPASIWQPQLLALGRQFRTIALDPRGQGDSEVPGSGYDADRRAGDLQELLAAQVPGSGALLVGWSLGGLDALQFVHRFGSGGLAGMVLVDNSVGEPPAPKPSNFISQLRSDRSGALDHFVRAMFARPQPEDFIESIKQSALRMPLADAIALLSYPLPREHWRDIARRFDKPLCYCVTTRYLEQARNLQKERPATRVEWFEKAGHALFIDEPDRFNRIVGEFAGALASRAAP
jgi:non-heme chloroperoxidase